MCSSETASMGKIWNFDFRSMWKSCLQSKVLELLLLPDSWQKSEILDVLHLRSRFRKLAGLEPKENSSGKHKGRSSISKRGRRKLRRLLFQVALPLIRSNEDFREVYTYYTTRKDNPLKGMQAMIAVSCKVIRIFYALLTHGMDYSSTRFRADITRPEPAKAA